MGSGSLWGHGLLIMSWPCCGDPEGGLISEGTDLLLFLFSLLFFSVGLILSRSLCFTSLSLSFSPSSSLVPVSCVLGGAGEGRDG